MSDTMESFIDGSYLLPSERLTPDNISLLQQYSGDIQEIDAYMSGVRSAMYNYQYGYTTKIVLNPTELQDYIARIREVTVRIAGGYDTDGTTVVAPLAANIIPDMLTTLRDNQITLCQLYALSVDSQGTLVGPLDKVDIEGTADGSDAV
mgnify:CR=1 FL=1